MSKKRYYVNVSLTIFINVSLTSFCCECDFGERRFVDGAKIVVEVFVVSGNSNHGGVVGGIAELRDVDGPTIFLCVLLKGVSQSVVGRDAARQSDMLDARLLDGQTEFLHQNLYDSIFQTGCYVGFVVLDEVGLFLNPFAHVVQE